MDEIAFQVQADIPACPGFCRHVLNAGIMVNAYATASRKTSSNFRRFRLIDCICGTLPAHNGTEQGLRPMPKAFCQQWNIPVSGVNHTAVSTVAQQVPVQPLHKLFKPSLTPILSAIQDESPAKAGQENESEGMYPSPKCSTIASVALPGIAVRLLPTSCVRPFVQVKRDFTSLFRATLVTRSLCTRAIYF